MTASTDRKPRRPRREAFSFEDVSVAAGKITTVDVPIARLPPGTWSNMPVVVIHGARPGPTIWLSGAIHGDELNGVEIVGALVRTLKPAQLAGTILAVPIVNVFGVTAGSRYLPDRRDLNRSFPGSPRGSLAGRLAHAFFEKVAMRCELGLDFHTASNGRDNLPQIRCDLDDAETARLARVFGSPLVMHSNLRDGSLRAAACKHDIKVLLYEAGEANRFDETAIATGVAGTRRVLHTLGMLENNDDAPAPPGLVARSSRWTRAGRSGFNRIRVELGEHVEKGQPVASISDHIGHKDHVVRCREGGMVIGILRTALVHRGDAIVHIATTTNASPAPTGDDPTPPR